MNLNGKTGRSVVHGTVLKPGQAVRVRVGAEDLGVGVVDEVTDGGDAVWIFFFGAAPRRLTTGNDSTEFTVLGSDARPGGTLPGDARG